MLPLEQFQLEHGQSMFSEQIAPLIRLRNDVKVGGVYIITHTAQTEMRADFKSERRGTENISQCSQSERSCTENLFREHFAGVVYREHMNGPLPV